MFMDATQDLTRFLRRRPDLWPAGASGALRLRPAEEGSSGDVWIIEEDSGRGVGVLRRCEQRSAARRLLVAHGLARRVAPGAAERPLPCLVGHDLSWWRTWRAGGPVLVEEWIEGESFASVTVDERRGHAEAIAEALRLLHGVTLPAERAGEVKVGERLRAMLAHRLDAFRDRPDLFTGDELEALERHTWSLMDSTPEPCEATLTHTHLAADDIRLRPSGRVAFIDIGALQFGAPEVDLVDALHVLGLADGDPEPLLVPYLAGRPAEEQRRIRRRLPLFHLLRDLGKLRARLRERRGGGREQRILELRDRLRARVEGFPLRSVRGGP